MISLSRLCLRGCVFTLAAVQLSCVLVLYYRAVASPSGGGGVNSASSGVGSGVGGGFSLKSLRLLLSEPAFQKINISSPEIYPLKDDREMADYFR